MKVRVARLARTWRHKFFNNAQFGLPDEMPAVAICSLRPAPFVMLGRVYADDLCGHWPPFGLSQRDISMKTFARVYGLGGRRSGDTCRKPMDS